MLAKLPYDILSIIMDFADTTTYWKTRFTNDVLTEIDQGIALVGMVTVKGVPQECVVCYITLFEKSKIGCINRSRHTEWRHVSYKDVLVRYPRCKFALSGMPFQTWKWAIYLRHAVYFREILSDVKERDEAVNMRLRELLNE